MAQRRSLAWTELRVGILVIVSFIILALGIFYVGGEASGIFSPKYMVTAYFPNATGLKPGAEVTLEGVTIGNVTDVRINTDADPSRAVVGEMRLLAEYQNIIRSDSMVTIQTAGLLGDRYVDITRGSTAGLPVADGGTLQGSDPGDIKQIITGTNDFIANLEVLSDQVRRMADRVDRGEGTLGKFLTDSAIYDNANLTVREANSLIRDARTGTGTIGRLISNDELHESFMALLTRVDTLVASLERGEGTAGKFLKDPSIANKTEQVITQVHGVMERIQRGEGTLGKLSQDDALYTDLRATMNRMNGLITSIENGEGTVGKLIKDPTLFNSANQATSEIQKLLYDFRADPKKFLTINFRLF